MKFNVYLFVLAIASVCIPQARAQIGHFLEEVYNRKRLHSAIGYLPPEEFENTSIANQAHVRTTP